MNCFVVKQAERYSMLSTMFSFMKQHKRMRHNSSSEGMYLADLSSGQVDPAITALYFPNNKTEKKNGMFYFLLLLRFLFFTFILRSFYLPFVIFWLFCCVNVF